MQWTQHISSFKVRQRWGDLKTISTRVKQRRLEWLGHLIHMPNHRVPKISLFSWLPQTRPRGGPRRRWRDVIHKDLKEMGVPENKWYEKVITSKARWQHICRTSISIEIDQQQKQQQQASDQTPTQVQCTTCQQTFRRESDMKRHKGLQERKKPISEQQGAVQCSLCSRWFTSQGGLAMHHCQATTT